jgi:hypothetical protein
VTGVQTCALPIFRTRDALAFANDQPCLQLSGGKFLALHARKKITIAGSAKSREFQTTRVLSPSLATVAEFPGMPLAEVPEADLLVTGESIYDTADRQYSRHIFYCSLSKKKIVRQIQVEAGSSDPHGLQINTLYGRICYVPKAEVLLFVGWSRDVITVQCGPLAVPEEVATAGEKSSAAALPAAAKVGKLVSFRLEFQKPANAQKLLYRIKKGLPGMRLDAATGAFTWTPSDIQIGKYDIAFVADVDGNEVPVTTWSVDVQF